MKSLNLQSPTLGITIFTSQGKRSHWIFLYEKLSKVTEKWTVTEKNLHWIYIPRIPVPEFAVTKAKNTEFSYNRNKVIIVIEKIIIDAGLMILVLLAKALTLS